MDNQKPTLKNAQKYYLEPGKIYGNYKVLESVIIEGKKSRETRWKCIYIPTGEEKLKKASDLAKFLTGEEQELRLKQLVKENKHQMGFRNYIYRTYKEGASKRNHEFYLTFDEVDSLIQQNCFYCGKSPKPASAELISKRGNSKEPTFYYNGIDRIDSSKHYTLDNVVPCCSECNYMKRTFSVSDFYAQVKKIYEHLKLGSTTIENTSKDGSE